MKRRVLAIVGLCGLLVLATASAQPPGTESTIKPGRSLTVPVGPYTGAPKETTSADAQTEEIEIMRRLLEQSLERQQHSVTGRITSAAFSPDGKTLAVDVSPNYSTWLDLSSGGAFGLNNRLDFGESIFSTATPLGSQLTGNKYGAVFTTPIGNAANIRLWDTTSGKQLYAVNSIHRGLVGHPGEQLGPQGVYLKGYGVVYTATRGLPTVPPVTDANKPAPKALSEWETTRRELRGEKIESSKATQQESLADAVLKVLSKNGQHFTQLPDTEQITVALTLSRADGCIKCHDTPLEKPKGGTGSSGNTGGSASSGTTPSSDSSSQSTLRDPVTGKPTNNILILDALKNDFQKEVLLGDLHMKQGKNDQAAAAFEAVLKSYDDTLETCRRMSFDTERIAVMTDAQLEKDYRLTAAKLLQVYAALGKKEDMKKLIKKLDAHVEKSGTGDVKNVPTPAPEKEELPGKLVISAPKKLLDLAGSGKITFEEFRKNATVEYQPPKTIEKPATK